MKRQFRLFLLMVILFTGLLLTATAVMADQPVTHRVRPGETLSSIAHYYGVSPGRLAAVNGIRNPNFIFIGQRLIIPGPGSRTVHVVRRGETLYSIARFYEVSVSKIARANGIRNLNRIFVGQRLIIPGAVLSATTSAPARPTPTPTPTEPVEQITIVWPTQGITVTSPVEVRGSGSGFEQSLVVRVLDEAGIEIGSGFAMITAELGQRGPYTGVVSFSPPADTQLGRIQVYSVSPRDGAIEHLNSVVVRLQGAPANAVAEQLKAAIESKDYAALQTLMPRDGWDMGFYRSEGITFSPDEAVQQLEDKYLGPGEVTVDLSVDARALLGNRVSFEPDVLHVLYSTGWGPDGVDDGFLTLSQVGDQVLWSGMLYVRHDLRDYLQP